MATYTPGQRARIVWAESEFRGREVTVDERVGGLWLNHHTGQTTKHPLFYRVTVDGAGAYHESGFRYAYLPEHLAPAVDPAADQFIERIKKIEREPITRIAEVA